MQPDLNSRFGLIPAGRRLWPVHSRRGPLMRSLILLGVFTAVAQAGPVLGTLAVDSPLRGAPRIDALDTGTLPRGPNVIVHHEDGDWLAVQPPRGSVSWISHLFTEFPDK